MSKLIAPLLFGCGAGIFLYAYNRQLPTAAYLTCIPFWPLVVMPSGMLWKNKFLAAINKGQFPPQMKNYRQMFIFHRKAIVYQLFLNQIGYHSILGLTFLAYTYWTRVIYDQQTPRKPFLKVLEQTLPGLFKLRAFFGILSLLTQFWGSKLSLIKGPQGNYYLTPNTIRALLLKETLINICWMSGVTNLAHEHYVDKKNNPQSNEAH